MGAVGNFGCAQVFCVKQLWQQAVLDPNNFYLPPYGDKGVKKKILLPQIWKTNIVSGYFFGPNISLTESKILLEPTGVLTLNP